MTKKKICLSDVTTWKNVRWGKTASGESEYNVNHRKSKEGFCDRTSGSRGVAFPEIATTDFRFARPLVTPVHLGVPPLIVTLISERSPRFCTPSAGRGETKEARKTLLD